MCVCACARVEVGAAYGTPYRGVGRRAGFSPGRKSTPASMDGSGPERSQSRDGVAENKYKISLWMKGRNKRWLSPIATATPSDRKQFPSATV